MVKRLRRDISFGDAGSFYAHVESLVEIYITLQIRYTKEHVFTGIESTLRARPIKPQIVRVTLTRLLHTLIAFYPYN
jgi:hypothetical protein